MTNPFEGRRGGDTSGTRTGKEMKVGEVRSFIPDPKNPDRVVVIHRTTRDYVYDLCDAYNAARTTDAVVWIVTRKGELALRAKNEVVHDAAPWKPNEEQMDELRRNLSNFGVSVR